MRSDSDDGTSTSGRQAQATLGTIPAPSSEMAKFWDTRIHELRHALVTEASQCLQHQVDQFERAFLAGGELARRDALDQAAKAMALKEAELESQDNQRQIQNSYFMNQYRTLTAKIERWDSFFFRQFGLSMNDWETQGFPSLLSGRQATIPTPVIPSPAAGQWRIPPGMCLSPGDHGAAYAANFSNLMLRHPTAPSLGVPSYIGTPARPYSVVTDQVTPPRSAPPDGPPPGGSGTE